MIKNALDYLRNNRNCTQVGGVGYSGGALPRQFNPSVRFRAVQRHMLTFLVMNLIQERPCRIEAAFMAHPGRLKTSAYGTSKNEYFIHSYSFQLSFIYSASNIFE